MPRISKYFILINLLISILILPSKAQSIDETFGLSFEALPDLRALTVQDDGKVLVVGVFTSVSGQASNPENAVNVVRLNEDGSIDGTFNLDSNLSGISIYDITKGINGTFALRSFNDLGGSDGLYVVNADGSLNNDFLLDSSITFVEEFIVFDGAFIAVASISGVGLQLIKINSDGSINEDFGRHSLNGSGAVRMRNITDTQILLLSGYSEYDGITINNIIKINSDGTLDNSFDAGNTPDFGTGNSRDVQIQSDGKIIIAGSFNDFNGKTLPAGLVRLNQDGSVDESFNVNLAGNFTNTVWSISLAADGKLYLGGQGFNGGKPAVDVFSLNNDGSVNNDFNKVTLNGPVNSFNQFVDVENFGETLYIVSEILGTNTEIRLGFVATNLQGEISNMDPEFARASSISDAVSQEDGKVVVVGDFIKVNGQPQAKIARVEPNGTLDESFTVDSRFSNFANSVLNSLAIQNDGKILVGGRINETTISEMVVRLNSDGSFDSNFNADASNSFSNQGPYSLIPLDDDTILIGGSRFTSNNTPNSPVSVALLNSDGNISANFNNTSLTNDFDVRSIISTDNGKFIVAGFKVNNGFIQRLNSDGSLDESFNNKDDLNLGIVRVDKVGENLIYGGVNLLGGSISMNIFAFISDLDGNNIDNTSLAISGITETAGYFDFSPFDDEAVFVGGRFSSINGVSQSNFAKISLNGDLDNDFAFNIVGKRVDRVLRIDQENIMVFGDFSQANDIDALSITKIKIVNTPSIITGVTQELNTDEEQTITLSLEDLEVEDPDDELEDMTLIASEGENYSFDGLDITPDIDFNGTLTVPILVNDGKDNSESFDLSIIVNPVNDTPVITAFNGTATTAEETNLEILLDDFSVTDPDNTFPNDYSISISDGDNYTVDGSSITPETDFNGTLTVSITTNDGTDDSQAFDISIEVTPVNDAPVITGTTLETVTDNETPIEINLADLIVTDPDNSYPSDFSLVIGTGDNYTLSSNSVVPTAEFIGNIVVPVMVNDGSVDSEPFNITIEVTEVTSIELGLVSKKIDLYPNPTEDILNMTIDNQIFDDVNIRILDSNGKSVFQGTYKKEFELLQKSILLNPLGSGIYIVEIIQGLQYKTLKKIIKK